MIARILNLCGLSLGREEDLVPPAPDNPDGFWENRRFQEINDQLLAMSGGAWDRAAELEVDPEEHLANLIEIVAADMSGVWGWKDPRSSLLLPFWKRRFPGLRIIVCVRDPLEVALSLRTRNGFSLESGLALWYDYNRAIVAATDEAERLIVHYSAFFDRPGTESRRMADYASVDADEEVIARATATIRRDLRHSEFPVSTFLEAELHPSILSLYAQLSDEAGWPLPHLEGFKDGATGELKGRLVNRAVVETKILEREVERARSLLNSYREQISVHERELRELRDAYNFRDSELATARRITEQLEQTVAQERLHSRNFVIERDDLRAQRDALAHSAALAAEEIRQLRAVEERSRAELEEQRIARDAAEAEVRRLEQQHAAFAASRGGKLLAMWWRTAGRLKPRN
jgi:hypothetical protein